MLSAALALGMLAGPARAASKWPAPDSTGRFARSPNQVDRGWHLVQLYRKDPDANNNRIPDWCEDASHRVFTTVPPWEADRSPKEFSAGARVRSVYVSPRPLDPHGVVSVYVEGDQRPIRYSVALFDRDGRRQRIACKRSTYRRMTMTRFRIPRDYPDSAVVVRVSIPHLEKLYAVVPIR